MGEYQRYFEPNSHNCFYRVRPWLKYGGLFKIHMVCFTKLTDNNHHLDKYYIITPVILEEFKEQYFQIVFYASNIKGCSINKYME